MARAEEQLDHYREVILALRRADEISVEEAGIAASTWASFSAGFLFGAGMPPAAATIAHLFRRAYPGVPFPMLWDGES